jgi:hypothetical protein
VDKVKEAMEQATETAKLDNISPTPTQQAQAKQQLEQNGILRQLETHAYHKDIPGLSDRYINLLATQLAYQQPENKDKAHRGEFMNLMKQINNDLNIPDTSASNFSIENAQATMEKLFDSQRGNKELIKARDQVMTNPALDSLKHPPKQNLNTLMELYSIDHIRAEKIGDQEFSQQHIQELYRTVADQLRQGIIESPEQKYLAYFLEKLDQAYAQNLPKLVTENTFMAMIGGPMQYLAPHQINSSYNLSNDIYIKNSIVQTTIGTDPRSTIAIDYAQPHPSIQVSDFLAKQEGGAFRVGIDNVRPTIISIANQQELYAQALVTIQSPEAQALKTSLKDPLAYQQALSELIYTQQMKLFEGKLGEKDLAKEVMHQQIDKNLTSQSTFELIKTILGPDTPLPNEMSKEKVSPVFWNFLQGLDTFLEESTTTERQLWRKNITKLITIIQQAKSGNLTGNHCDLFKNSERFTAMMHQTKQALQGPSTDGSDFFSLIFAPCLSSTGTAHPEYFFNLMTENEKLEPNPLLYAPIQSNYDERYDKQRTASNILKELEH